jgi:cyclin H
LIIQHFDIATASERLAVVMHEDEIYRGTSQFRLWSFTPARLTSLREGTNTLASSHVKDAVRRNRGNGLSQTSSGITSGTSSDIEDNKRSQNLDVADVDCLTVGEELLIVEYYCAMVIEVSTSDKDFSFPPDVIVSTDPRRIFKKLIQISQATAVQFMKRFYLSNSPMTYHPRDIMLTALFFVTKSEPFYTSLDKFVSKMQPHATKRRPITAETVLAPEFILTQGLRFTFDVKHPYRALRGIYMELLSMSEGSAALPAHEKRTSSQIAQDLRSLKTASGSTAPVMQRLGNAYAKASALLKRAAILTDAYFLYTPSQIAFAALLLADKPLTEFYLSTKFPASATKIQAKVTSAVRQCAKILKEGPKIEQLSRDELIKIDKKLWKCQNPEKADLVSLNKAVKRNHSVDGQANGDQAKKRKVEREKHMSDGDDLFGPDLKQDQAKGPG